MYELVSSHYDHDVPKIDPTGPVPPYLQVAEILRSQIRSGQLSVGSRITEAEITETYEIARSTARRTLAVLRDEGLIYTVPPARELCPLTLPRQHGHLSS